MYVYAPTDEKSDDEDLFYKQLLGAYDQIGINDKSIIGDMNAKDNITKHRLHDENNGNRNMIISSRLDYFAYV